MPYFVVTREHGVAWDDARSIREQDAWDEHAAFMDALVEDRFVLLGGPLGDHRRALLVIEAPDEGAVEARLLEDPWSRRQLLETGSLQRWAIWLGRLACTGW